MIESISLADFENFNNDYKIITKKDLTKIKKQLKLLNICFYSNKNIYNDDNLFLKFKHHNDNNDNNNVSLVVIKNVKDFDKIMYSQQYFDSCDSYLFFNTKLSNSETKFVNEFKHKINNTINFENFQSFYEYVLQNVKQNTIEWSNDSTLINNFKEIYKFDFRSELNKISIIKRTNDNDNHNYYNNNYSNSLYNIIYVDEVRINDINYRISFAILISDSTNFNKHYNTNIIIHIVKDSNYDLYTKFDKGALFFKRDGDMIFIDRSCLEYNKEKELIINENLYDKLYDDLNQIKDENYIPPMIYKKYKKIYEQYNTNLSDKDIIILEKYKKRIKSGKEIQFNGIFIKENCVYIKGEMFKFEYLKDMEFNYSVVIPLIRKLSEKYNVRYNLNNFYLEILKSSPFYELYNDINHNKYANVKYYKRKKEIPNNVLFSYKINNLKICIKYSSQRFFINDIMVKFSDIIPLLENALCFTNIEEYNLYLADARKIGLDWKNLIVNGYKKNNAAQTVMTHLIKFKNPNILVDDQYKLINTINLFFVWDKIKRSHIYVRIGNGDDIKMFKIKSKPKFLNFLENDIYNCSYLKLKRLFIEHLEGFKEEYMYQLIKYGLNELVEMKKKGIELINLTVKSVDATYCKELINNSEVEGYILYGHKTKTKYFISKSNLSVYRYENGKWNSRCVVDDRSKNRIFEDKLANRLVNIYNEPERIFTLYN